MRGSRGIRLIPNSVFFQLVFMEFKVRTGKFQTMLERAKAKPHESKTNLLQQHAIDFQSSGKILSQKNN